MHKIKGALARHFFRGVAQDLPNGRVGIEVSALEIDFPDPICAEIKDGLMPGGLVGVGAGRGHTSALEDFINDTV